MTSNGRFMIAEKVMGKESVCRQKSAVFWYLWVKAMFSILDITLG
jgi:hypothetical protein